MEKSKIILSYILNELVDDQDMEVLEDTSLFEGRVLDSLNLVTIISFLEKTFDVKVNTSEVTVENLDSVKNMLSFLERKGAK